MYVIIIDDDDNKYILSLYISQFLSQNSIVHIYICRCKICRSPHPRCLVLCYNCFRTSYCM